MAAAPPPHPRFFIPMRLRSHRDSAMFVKGLEYINTTWPYLQRYRGHRHFIVHTGGWRLEARTDSCSAAGLVVGGRVGIGCSECATTMFDPWKGGTCSGIASS